MGDEIEIVPYDPAWPRRFESEKHHLRDCLPPELIGRIEHFGSTAVPGLAAKPIIDMLVEVTSLTEAARRIVPVLEAQGYDYFWRPSWYDENTPSYIWFIKRNEAGERTHHVHFLEADSHEWERLLFRDYLREHPDTAHEYAELKHRIARDYPNDRIAYAREKTAFINRITKAAHERYHSS